MGRGCMGGRGPTWGRVPSVYPVGVPLFGPIFEARIVPARGEPPQLPPFELPSPLDSGAIVNVRMAPVSNVAVEVASLVQTASW